MNDKNDGDYYHANFDLNLTWNDGVWVEHNGAGKIYCGKYSEREFSKDKSKIFLNDTATQEEIIFFGKNIAKLLFPPGKDEGEKLRDRFLDKWRRCENIRLRFLYSQGEDQINELMKIPWEYIYLPKLLQENGQEDNLENLLGLRYDISIVHCLPDDNQPDAGVENLRVKMTYLSWLGNDKGSENKIYNDFIEEWPKLETIINCSNISSSKPAHIEAHHSEPTDVVIALESHHFIHLTAHGEVGRVELKKGDVSTSPEMVISELGPIKVVVLLICASSEGTNSIAFKLHQDGVPMVIGMTRSIDPSSIQNFVDGFYKAIAAWPSQGLEKAIVRARKSIFRENDKQWALDFGIPRFFLNSKNSILIPESKLYDVSGKMVEDFDGHIARCLKGILKEEVENNDQQEGQDNIQDEDNFVIEYGDKLYVQKISPDAINTKTKNEIQKNETVQEIRSKLTDWLEEQGNNECRWFFLTGESGSGKSTLIAQLVEEYKYKDSISLIYHFCLDEVFEPDDSDRRLETTDPLVFVLNSLVPQLIKHFKRHNIDKYEDLCPPGRFPLLTHNADAALIDFVCYPLLKAKEEKGVDILPVIVIDGLDVVSANQSRNNSILRLLLRHRDRLDDVARFLVTANEEYLSVREDILNLTLRNEPDLCMPSPPQKLSKDRIGKIIRSKIHRYGSLSNDNVLTIAQKLPLPLFYRLAERFENTFSWSDDILQKEILDQTNYKPSLFVDRLIEYAITSAKQKHTEDWWEEKVDDVLNVVALAYESLYPCDVAAITKLKLDSKEMKKLCEVLAPFFADRDEHDKLTLYHDELKMYLRDRMNEQSQATTHELFVEAFRPKDNGWDKANWSDLINTYWKDRYPRWSPDTADNTSDKIPPRTVAPRYVRRYLVYHAYELCQATDWSDAKRRQRANDFLNLVCDPGYRTVRLAEEGQEAAVQDLWKGLRIIYTEHIHNLSSVQNNRSTRKAFDRLMEANEPGSSCRKELIKLEREIRRDHKDVGTLWKFLDLPQDGG